VRRLERAQLAAERQTLHQRSKIAKVNDDIYNDLEKRYQLSMSQKDRVNIYSYVYEHEGDPAFKVRLCVYRSYLEASYSINLLTGFHPKTQRSLTRAAS
jgi:hypothetical protein